MTSITVSITVSGILNSLLSYLMYRYSLFKIITISSGTTVTDNGLSLNASDTLSERSAITALVIPQPGHSRWVAR